MTKKKVLLWHWGRRGGGPRYTLELVRALQEQNTFDIHLSLSRQSEIFDHFSALNLPSHHIDTYHNLSSAVVSTLRLPIIRKQFWHYVKQHRIDLIVCTMSHVWNVPILTGKQKRPPYVMVLHDALPHPGDDVPLRHWLLKREIGYTDGVVTLTEHVRRILCKEYAYPTERSWVVPHGIFPYPFLPPEPSDKLRLLFFGRILPYKGLDLLLDAYAELRAENCPVELFIAGAGDLSPYAEKLGKLQGITLQNRWITEHDIGPIFAKADVAVLPYVEASQSGVIATAYAGGMPVIATPVGGLVEQVKHEQTGLICEETNATSLAASIRRMLDPALRATYAAGARHEAEHALSWSTVARDFNQAMQIMLQIGKR